MCLAAEVALTFHRIILVAPYVLPCCSDVVRGKMITRLPMYGHNLVFAYGENDPWPPCNFIQEIRLQCHSIVFSGVGHEASLAKGLEFGELERFELCD